jgi:hypothetical protein
MCHCRIIYIGGFLLDFMEMLQDPAFIKEFKPRMRALFDKYDFIELALNKLLENAGIDPMDLHKEISLRKNREFVQGIKKLSEQNEGGEKNG